MFKVGGKNVCAYSIGKIPLQINLKCDPEKAMELREQYEDVQPGWHMSKIIGTLLCLNGNIRWSDLENWIDHSYDEVVKGLKKSEREKLK
ncbi:MAG: MmcQ/YjbR family DNA-binding protein [Ignavibacteriales bacterium]|nr:MmcQ/YjbR family DNA-binding protein [Ignavibacteriales bacterium]